MNAIPSPHPPSSLAYHSREIPALRWWSSASIGCDSHNDDGHRQPQATVHHPPLRPTLGQSPPICWAQHHPSLKGWPHPQPPVLVQATPPNTSAHAPTMPQQKFASPRYLYSLLLSVFSSRTFPFTSHQSFNKPPFSI